MITIVSCDKLLSTIKELQPMLAKSADDWICMYCSQINTPESNMLSTNICDAIFPAAFLPGWTTPANKQQIRPLFLDQLLIYCAGHAASRNTMTEEELNKACRFALFHAVSQLNRQE